MSNQMRLKSKCQHAMLMLSCVLVFGCSMNAMDDFENSLKEKIGKPDVQKFDPSSLFGRDTEQICVITPYQTADKLPPLRKPAPGWVGEEGYFGFLAITASEEKYFRIKRGFFEAGPSYPLQAKNKGFTQVITSNCVPINNHTIVSIKSDERIYIYLMKD